MKNIGFTGISFPFRIGNKGGVVMSTTSITDVQHIIEGMTQILNTRPKERGMEFHFKSEIDTDIFEPNDESARTMLAYQITEALSELEDRINIESVDVVSEGATIIAVVHFTVLAYNTSYTANIKVGEIDVSNPN